MFESLITAESLALVAKGVKAAYEAVVGCPGPHSTELKSFRALGGQRTFGEFLCRIGLVRTILLPRSSIDIRCFYHPGRLRTSRGLEPRALGRRQHRLHEPDVRLLATPTLIEGTVGQGKSILMRWLALQELLLGERIPLFFELRRLTSAEPQENWILRSISVFLARHGITMSPNLIHHLVESGGVTLILDGFDETPEALKGRCAEEIDMLASTRHRSDGKPAQPRVVVSSRPGECVAACRSLSMESLAPIGVRDYRDIIAAFKGNETLESIRDKVLDTIGTGAASSRPTVSPDVERLLTTPLLVHFFALQVFANPSPPATRLEFHRKLMTVLLNDHYGVQSNRPLATKSGLSDQRLELAFSGFAMKSFHLGQVRLNRFRTAECAQFALETASVPKADGVFPEVFVTDIVSNTAFLQQDAGEIEFVQKSIQEYYTAYYVAGRSEKYRREWYEGVLARRDGGARLAAVLGFCRELDSYAFAKFYAIPLIGKFSHGKSGRLELDEVAAALLREVITIRVRVCLPTDAMGGGEVSMGVDERGDDVRMSSEIELGIALVLLQQNDVIGAGRADIESAFLRILSSLVGTEEGNVLRSRIRSEIGRRHLRSSSEMRRSIRRGGVAADPSVVYTLSFASVASLEFASTLATELRSSVLVTALRRFSEEMRRVVESESSLRVLLPKEGDPDKDVP